VCLRLFVMRKGYEFLLQGWEALWQAAAAAAAAAQSGAGDASGAACLSIGSTVGAAESPSLHTAAAADVEGIAAAAATARPRAGRGRLQHVDELWEEQAGGSSSLQVREWWRWRGQNWQQRLKTADMAAVTVLAAASAQFTLSYGMILRLQSHVAVPQNV
jgi:hypothetical protein